MTEKLVKEQQKIARPDSFAGRRQIGDLEDKIRKRVEEILYELEGGEEEQRPSSPERRRSVEDTKGKSPTKFAP